MTSSKNIAVPRLCNLCKDSAKAEARVLLRTVDLLPNDVVATVIRLLFVCETSSGVKGELMGDATVVRLLFVGDLEPGIVLLLEMDIPPECREGAQRTEVPRRGALGQRASVRARMCGVRPRCGTSACVDECASASLRAYCATQKMQALGSEDSQMKTAVFRSPW